MKYDLTLFPVSDDNEQLKDEKGALVTFRQVLLKVIVADNDSNGQIFPLEEKMARYAIYKKLKKAKEVVELSPEEAALLNKSALSFATVIAGQTCDFLNQTEEFPAPDVQRT